MGAKTSRGGLWGELEGAECCLSDGYGPPVRVVGSDLRCILRPPLVTGHRHRRDELAVLRCRGFLALWRRVCSLRANRLQYSALCLRVDHGVALQPGGLSSRWYTARAGGDSASELYSVPA